MLGRMSISHARSSGSWHMAEEQCSISQDTIGLAAVRAHVVHNASVEILPQRVGLPCLRFLGRMAVLSHDTTAKMPLSLIRQVGHRFGKALQSKKVPFMMLQSPDSVRDRLFGQIQNEMLRPNVERSVFNTNGKCQ